MNSDYVARLKSHIACARVNDAASFRVLRNIIDSDEVLRCMTDGGYVSPDTGKLTVGSQPFNYFARIGHGKPNFAPQLGVSEGFVICHKTAEHCEHYDDPEYKKGAMAGPDENGPGHVFLTTTNLDWKYFNVAVIDDVDFLLSMKREALKYVRARNWKNYGLFFHCFPLNSVQSLHLHVVNLDRAGTHYEKKWFKNLHVDDVLAVLDR